MTDLFKKMDENEVCFEKVMQDFFTSLCEGKSFVEHARERYVICDTKNTKSFSPSGAKLSIYDTKEYGGGSEWMMFTSDKVDQLAALYKVTYRSRANATGFANFMKSNQENAESQFKFFSKSECKTCGDDKEPKEIDAGAGSSDSEEELVSPSELSLKGLLTSKKKEDDTLFTWKDDDVHLVYNVAFDEKNYGKNQGSTTFAPTESTITPRNARSINRIIGLISRNDSIISTLAPFEKRKNEIDDRMINQFFEFIKENPDHYKDGNPKTHYKGTSKFAPGQKFDTVALYDVIQVKKKLCKGDVYKRIVNSDVKKEKSGIVATVMTKLGLRKGKDTIMWDDSIANDVRQILKMGTTNKRDIPTRRDTSEITTNHKIAMFTHFVCKNKALSNAENIIKQENNKYGLPPLSGIGLQILFSLWRYYPTESKRDHTKLVSEYVDDADGADPVIATYTIEQLKNTDGSNVITDADFVKATVALKYLSKLRKENKVLVQKDYQFSGVQKVLIEIDYSSEPNRAILEEAVNTFSRTIIESALKAEDIIKTEKKTMIDLSDEIQKYVKDHLGSHLDSVANQQIRELLNKYSMLLIQLHSYQSNKEK